MIRYLMVLMLLFSCSKLPTMPDGSSKYPVPEVMSVSVIDSVVTVTLYLGSDSNFIKYESLIVDSVKVKQIYKLFVDENRSSYSIKEYTYTYPLSMFSNPVKFTVIKGSTL